MSNFGRNLKRVRKERNLTLMELEEKSNISANQLSRIERGQNPKLSTMEQIASALDIPLTHLLASDFCCEEKKKKEVKL